MRKALFVFLALLATVFALTSCKDEEKINEAINKTKGLEYIDADIYLDVNMEADYDTRHFKETKHIIRSKNDKGEVLVSQVNKAYGKDEATVIFFDSEYAYLTDGTKMALTDYNKYSTDYNELIDQLLLPFPQSVTKRDENGVRFITVNNMGGDLIVSLKVNSNDRTEDIKVKREALNSMLSLMTSSAVSRVESYLFCEDCQMQKDECPNCGMKAFEDCDTCTSVMARCKRCVVESVEVESNSIDLRIENGYVTELEANFDMFITTGEGSVSANAKIKVVINNPGEQVSVELPAGYESFEEKRPIKRPILKDLVKFKIQ